MRTKLTHGQRGISFTRLLLLSVALVGILTNAGCIRFAANLIYAIRGNDSPAEYDGLRDKRVAIICSTSGAVASEAVNSMLSSNIVSSLSRNLPKADIVRQKRVDKWIQMDSFPTVTTNGLPKALRPISLLPSLSTT
ncbi:MAG: hypothetical protein U0930_21125 [Pirellulales bacterium]